MDPLRRIEIENRQEWDEVSEVSTVPPPVAPVPTAGPPRRAGGRRGIDGRGGRYQSSGTGRGNPQSRYDPNQQRRPPATSLAAQRGRARGFDSGRGHGGLQASRAPPKVPGTNRTWANMTPLTTTRKAEQLEEKRLKEAEDRQYKQEPHRLEEFPSMAYYLWPSTKSGQSPEDILGHSLEGLDKVRIDYKVFIVPSHDGKCLKICSRVPDDDSRLHTVIHAIRQVIRHRQAIRFAAEPTYIIVPPQADNMMTTVLPIQGPAEPKRSFDTIGVKLGGEKLSDSGRLEWVKKYPNRAACRDKFEQTMTKALTGLQSYRGGMRMRVTFGHFILQTPMKTFARGKQGWEDFLKMMESPVLKSTFDARFNDFRSVAVLRNRILEMPGVEATSGMDRNLPLQAIPFKFTSVVCLDTPTTQLRVEAEIDVLSETGEGEYQVGATRYFNVRERNKRMQLIVVDAEKELDWAIDIVTEDGMNLNDIPDAVQRIIQESVTTRSRIRRDYIGLFYPEVKLQLIPGVTVKEIILKSVVGYKLGDTDSILEFTFVRSWNGADTSVEPVLSASVAIYRQDWEWKMEQLMPTDEDRDWARPLKTFFGKDFETDKSDTGAWGVERFIVLVQNIQGLLVHAIKTTNEGHPGSGSEAQRGSEAATDLQSREEGVDRQPPNLPCESRPPSQNDNGQFDSPYGDLYSAD